MIVAPTRWKLRAAIRLVNRALAELKLCSTRSDVHRQDQPGLRLPRLCVHVNGAQRRLVGGRTVRQRVAQLFEQDVDLLHIGTYVRRWLGAGGRTVWTVRWFSSCGL